jgi:beta-galactosidase GanA
MDKLYLGADYYPEAWDESEIDNDVKKMKETGFNIVRIAEFAWHKMEPEENKYDFAWLHRVVDKMRDAGIKVIMGTPTATPPHWLYNKYPDMAVLQPEGHRTQHGGRRHCCSSNPQYIESSKKIVERLAQEFGKDENIIGWQIDNEIYHKPCMCEHCMARFHDSLRKKYGSVDAINKAWGLECWSVAYESIDTIPSPLRAWCTPHVRLEWELSHMNNHMEFVHMQAEIIKKYSDKPIGTDTMPYNAFDYRKLNGKLDVAQLNHYSQPYYMPTMTFWLDYMRKFSKQPYWVTETQATWNGGTSQGMYVFEDNFIHINSWITYMFGGEANLYWLWRTHWANHELCHGAVLDTNGRYTHAHNEIVKLAKDVKKAEDFILNTEVKSNVALTCQSLNWNIHATQEINASIQKENGEIYDFYGAMLKEGVHPDVIDLYESIEGYKVIFSPFAFTLEEADFEKKITQWVHNGGTWVVGPLSDIRTNIGTRYKNSPYGFLEKLTGAYQLYNMPTDKGLFECKNELGETVKCAKSFEIFEDMGESNLITITKGHKSVVNKPCALEINVGKGKVIILGTIPEEKELRRIITKAVTEQNADKFDITGSVVVVRREGEKHSGYMIADIMGEGGTFRFDGKMKDILTDTVHDGYIKLDPFCPAVLVKA